MIKRVIDIFVSCLMLIILSPVFFIVSILIYLKMGKPVFLGKDDLVKMKKYFLCINLELCLIAIPH